LPHSSIQLPLFADAISNGTHGNIYHYIVAMYLHQPDIVKSKPTFILDGAFEWVDL